MTTQTLSKAHIISALRSWLAQRPGLEPGNYGDLPSYRSEARRILRQLHAARTMLAYVDGCDAITSERLLAAMRRAYSGRLGISESGEITYAVGQYWPTEYRAAVCAVLASAIWDHYRDAMPEPAGRRSKLMPGGAEWVHDLYRYKGRLVSAGDYLRGAIKDRFGAGIARVWFN